MQEEDKPKESKEKEKWKRVGNKVVENKKSAAVNRRKHMKGRAGADQAAHQNVSRSKKAVRPRRHDQLQKKCSSIPHRP